MLPNVDCVQQSIMPDFLLPKISAILVNDTGTGRIVTVGAHENYNAIGPLQEILAPVSS